jgi:hypothetical protein
MKQPLVLLSAAIAAIVIVAVILLGSPSSGASARTAALRDVLHAPPVSETVAVGSAPIAPALSPGFLGFSVEYQSIAVNAGPAAHPDTVFDQLVSNLNPGQRPVIRIGGDSTDHTWYPTPGVSSAGLTFTLTPAWMQSVATFARATNAKLILGINLEVNNPKVAATEGRALLAGIGADHIDAFEVGNEPSLFSAFPWYLRVPNDRASGVFARPKSYSFGQFVHEYVASAAALPKLPLAGPALGSATWMQSLPQLLAVEPAMKTVTFHAYPMNCFAAKGTPEYPSLANLLAPAASDGLAAELANFVKVAHAAGRSFRVDELNSVACGGTAGISNTFASALWVTDALYAMASRGVNGVNIQDFNAGRYKPFAFREVAGHWVGQVYPLYYGLLLFTRAVPPGSRLLALHTGGGNAVRAWAAQTPASSADHGAETVTLINANATRAETVDVRVPHTTGGTFLRMLDPGGAAATSGELLGGAGFGPETMTGRLDAQPTLTPISPGAHDTYAVSLPPASAVLLTLRH